MRSCDRLKNGEPISAIFLTEHMTEAEVKPYQCPFCGHIGAGVIRYEAKVGGSDELVTITSCNDLEACKERQAREGE